MDARCGWSITNLSVGRCDDHQYCSAHASVELDELRLFRHGFDDALRSHGGNDSRELVIGGIE